MSAFAYIESSDLPRPLLDTAARRVDGTQNLIAFIGCPLTGVEQEDGEIQFPFPRASELRAELRAWLDYWSLSHRIEH